MQISVLVLQDELKTSILDTCAYERHPSQDEVKAAIVRHYPGSAAPDIEVEPGEYYDRYICRWPQSKIIYRAHVRQRDVVENEGV